MINSIETLVLSGGGVLGYCYIGILKYLEECNIVASIKNIIGCSAGAIFAGLISLGYTSDELYTLLISLNPSEYFDITLDNFILFPKYKGIERGDKYMEKITHMISLKTGNPNTTFHELFTKTGITLNIGITNITTLRFELCNWKTYPNLPIATAIRASVAIPILIHPVKINNHYYCDGGVSNNYPIDYADDDASTLGIYLTNEHNKSDESTDYLSSIEDMTIAYYIERILKSGSNIIKILDKYQHNTITIDIPRDVATSFKFIASLDDIAKCIEYGYLKTAQQLPSLYSPKKT